MTAQEKQDLFLRLINQKAASFADDASNTAAKFIHDHQVVRKLLNSSEEDTRELADEFYFNALQRRFLDISGFEKSEKKPENTRM